MQPIEHPVNNQKRNYPIILGFFVLLLVVGGGAYYLGTQYSRIQSDSNNINSEPATNISSNTSPSSTLSPTVSIKSNIYKNHKYSLQFYYPDNWKVIYDEQPDPTGNPLKHSITLENTSKSQLNVTILKSEQYQTFASLSGLINLPSGTATIISQKEISVGGQRALYIIQNNNQEGFVLLSPDNNMVIFETNSKDKETLNEIIPTIQF